jgi:hypothetical protein
MFRAWVSLTPSRSAARRLSTAVAAEEEQLAGTVPPHSLYIVLRTPASPRTFSSRVQSPLRLNVQQQILARGGLVNFMHTTDMRAFALSARLASPPIHEMAPSAEDELPVDEEDGAEVERYDAVAFAAGRVPLHLRGVSHVTADERMELVHLVQQRLPPLRRFRSGEYAGPVHLYVCTHGERDCRCGTHGTALADALREEVWRRRRNEQGGIWDRVVVGEVAHVGGHK